MDSPGTDLWTWIAIGGFVLCIGTALVLTLYYGDRKEPDAKKPERNPLLPRRR